MYTKKIFKGFDLLMWTRFETLMFTAIILVWVSLYHFFDLHWLKIPWTPLALIGTAVAFVIGFQNNSAYGRIWEARKIWGGIVNTSRTFGMFVRDMVSNEHVKTALSEEELKREVDTLVHRHIAWLTALRYAMRQSRPWETSMDERSNREWNLQPPEHKSNLEEELSQYLSKEDLDAVLAIDNKPTALLYQQSAHLKRLKEQGAIWEFSFLEIENILQELFNLQGKSERIKNFPYPRQFATLNHYFMWVFVMFMPMALVPQFAEIGANVADKFPVISQLFVWFSIPFYVAVAWMFHTMERIGRTGENPFEGTANDVPISTIARGIEIDMRQNQGEDRESIPAQFPVVYDIQF